MKRKSWRQGNGACFLNPRILQYLTAIVKNATGSFFFFFFGIDLKGLSSIHAISFKRCDALFCFISHKLFFENLYPQIPSPGKCFIKFSNHATNNSRPEICLQRFYKKKKTHELNNCVPALQTPELPGCLEAPGALPDSPSSVIREAELRRQRSEIPR